MVVVVAAAGVVLVVVIFLQECRAVPPWDADLSEMRSAVDSFAAREYVAPLWARNAHLHTIVASGDMEKKIMGDRTVRETFAFK